MAPSPIPPADISPDSPAEATSYFELERRRGGETRLGGEKLPPLPKTHWTHDPVPAEPTIDRSVEDGPTIDINQER
jgi:hypothetical protein